MATTLKALRTHAPRLTTPLHTLIPFPIIDVFGAMRLSSVVNWMATGAFDPPSANGIKKARASLLQELFGLMVVVFGGETFLCVCTGTTPSWLITPKVALLFCLTHAIQTRTSLLTLLPARPTLALELLLSLPDAIGRTLLLTQFSILPILHPSPGSLSIRPTPSSLILVPFILAVPFPAMIFTGTSFFSPIPKLKTPVDLKPWGWTAADAWCPAAIPALFLSLSGPVEGWETGLGLREDEAVILCMIVLWGIFAARAVYNFGYKREHWTETLGLTGGRGKIKTA